MISKPLDKAGVMEISRNNSLSIHSSSNPQPYQLYYTSFTHTLPSRCKKEIIHAADVRKDGLISLEGVMMIVENIGASTLVTRKDMEGIFYELGEESEINSDRESGSTGLTIAKERMLQIL